MADGWGNVYVFNLYGSPVSGFNLNSQGSAGTVPIPDKTKGYTPSNIAVERTNLEVGQLTSPLFVNGSNSFTVNYSGTNWSGSVTIPGLGEFPSEADFVLYLAYDKAFLFSASGTFVPQPTADGAVVLTKDA